MKEKGKLWGEALKLANSFAFSETDSPRQRFDEIGEEMGGCTSDLTDLRALLRIAIKAKKDEREN